MDLTLTVVEIHTKRSADAKVTVKFLLDDKIEFTFKGKPSELASLAVAEKLPLTRVVKKK